MGSAPPQLRRGPPEPQREAATGQGLGVSGGYAQGQAVVAALVLTGKGQRQLRVGRDDNAVLADCLLTPPCLFVFPFHGGDMRRERQPRIISGHSFLLAHSLYSPCYRPISELVTAIGMGSLSSAVSFSSFSLPLLLPGEALRWPLHRGRSLWGYLLLTGVIAAQGVWMHLLLCGWEGLTHGK